MEQITLILRILKGEELTWQEVDQNWEKLKDGINYLLNGQKVMNYNEVPAGELEVTHNMGVVPSQVCVWQKVSETRWVQVDTPDVSYTEDTMLNKVSIRLPDTMGTIKVFIKQ